MRNTLRLALREGVPTFGSWIQFGHTGIAELMAQAGFDWLVIDLEHSTIGIESVQPLIQVIELCACVPLVRVPSNDPVLAKRVMDAGAHGIIVPAINSPQEAERAVESVKYPPAGRRGLGLSRAQGYGSRLHEYISEVDQYGVVVVMIEQREAVEQIDRILHVPGVDAIFVGPYDLSASYGVPGEFDHRLVREAMNWLLRASAEAKVAAGIHVVHPNGEQVRERLLEGFRFVAYGGDMLFLGAAVHKAIAELRGLVAKGDKTALVCGKPF